MHAIYRITGTVQGVGFRAFVQRLARSASITGFAKNESTGTVLVYLVGDEHAITHILPQLHRGPPRAIVTAVTPVDPDFFTF